jgi:hypothetical protein
MSSRKEHAYEVALRIAQVKELRAQVALASAVDKEAEARNQVEAVEAARRSVLQASNGRTAAGGQQMDLARYELLARLDVALAHRLQRAGDVLDQAAQLRAERAAENVNAKRHRERVGEHLGDVRRAGSHALAAKAQEEGIELWLGSCGEQP